MKLAEHLDDNLFTDQVLMVANRDGYGNGLKEAGEADKNVVALSADLTESTRTNLFAEAFPDRFVQVGIAEQNMASVASGMSSMGKVPFIASYAMFSPGRSWEQIRTTIAYNNSNVKIIGAHSGISVGPDGATHQAIEDMALMRVVPNMTVIAPLDVNEAQRATLWAAKHQGPVYIRIAREKTPVVTSVATPFVPGQGIMLMEAETENPEVGIITTGTLAYEALLAGKELNDKGIATSVLHIHTIKPLDKEAVLALAKSHKYIITIEEHQIAGGLGGAVCEYLSEVHPTKVLRLGIKDEFGQSGEPIELLKHYGLDKEAIIKTVDQLK